MCTHKRRPWAREDGFTLVESLVASLILLVGLMGTLAMLDGSTSAQSGTRSREGATNLAREFLETVRGAAYGSVNDSVLTATLQGMAGYQSISGSTATIQRRNTRYAVTASVCSVDDPKDGLGTTDATFCAASTPTSPADNQPDDLKRVRVSITWPGKRSTTITQTAMLSSTGAVVGLPTQTFTMSSPGNIGASATAPIITAASTVVAPCAANVACFTANAPGAKKIIFAVDGADQSGAAVTMDATCSALPCAKWHFAWDYSGLSDGVYRVTARSVDVNDVEGLPKSILVTISRGGRSAPCALGSSAGDCRPVEGGYNDLPGSSTPIFEVRWQANPERNVIGYEVQTGSGAAGTGTVVCRLDAQGRVTSPAGQTDAAAPGLEPYACIDTSPPAPSATAASYGVYARYSDGASGTIINGPVSTVSQAGGSSTTTTTYSAPITKTFGLDNRTSASGCSKDMTDGWGGSGTSVASAAGPGTVTFCTPLMSALFPTASSVSVQGPVDVAHTMYLNGSGPKKCTATWALSTGATGLLNSGAGLQFSGGGDKQTAISNSNLALSSTAVPLSQRLQLAVTMAAPGSNCDDSNILFGGTTSGVVGNPAPGLVRVRFVTGTTTTVVNTWARANAPTAVTKATTGPTTATVSWTGSAGGNVAFYRIYRDGRLYSDRYDTCDVGDFTPGCDDNDGTFTYVDENTGGTSHTYWVTAVYGTGSPVASTLAESAQVAAT